MIKNNFRCPLSTLVCTNLQVIDHGRPITVVIHETDDGDWKFFSRDEKMNSDEKPIYITLGEILMIDPSVGEISHLLEGSIATRRYLGDNWTIISEKQHHRQGSAPKKG